MIFKNDGKTLPYVEHFGPTIQGEGMVVGQKTYFVRFAGCDYSCSWCDSKFSWDGSVEPMRKTPHDLAEEILTALRLTNGELNCSHITLSGGNPALHGELMREFITELRQYGFTFSIETQGTAFQSWFELIDDFVLSPKPKSSGMKTNWEHLTRFVTQLSNLKVNYTFKLVVMDEHDLEFLTEVIDRFPSEKVIYASVGNPTPYSLEPVSPMLLQKLGWLWDEVVKNPKFNKVRPLPQTHVLVYENRRGV